MSEMSGGGGRRLAVFAIPESKDGEKKFWPKIGVAFPNRDGSTTLLLDALPIGTNKLQVREERERPLGTEGRANGNGPLRRELETLEVRP
ncbi:MAG: hypothetical protein QM767_27185 [Anaeromyxobacter sp.]